jgi:Uma2 family endonuclease
LALAPEKDPYLFTACEYLTFERAALDRHEWLDGVIYAMAGESQNHGRICTNLTSLLHAALRGTPCEVLSKDMRVLSGPREGASRRGLYSYPDLVVVCGEARTLDERHDVLTNPRVVIEVLSPSTQAFDRSEKGRRYRTWLASLKEYLLVAQDRPHIEHWRKQPDGEWLVRDVEGLSLALVLQSLDDVHLPLVEVYERVVFPPEPEA